MIYLDNAATTFPKPKSVANSMYNCIVNYGGNPGRGGHKMSIKAAEIVYNMREKAAQMFGITNPECVILTKNCTESLNIAIFSILKDGGNVIISNFEHNSVIRPLEYLKSQQIADYKIAKTSFLSIQNTINEFERLIDSNTKAIICTHASNVIGNVAPIKELGQLCSKKGILLCVDASQTAGILEINMDKDGIDILCCPGHKGLYGPAGTGLLITKNNISMSPIMFGGTGSLSKSLLMPDFLPDMLESGTINVPGAAGLAEGLNFVNSIGIKNIYSHEFKLTNIAYNKLKSLSSILLYTPQPSAIYSVPTISFNVKGYDCTEVSDVLNRNNIAVRSGLHCSPLAHEFLGTKDTGTVRISFSIFNTERDIIRLIDTLSKI